MITPSGPGMRILIAFCLILSSGPKSFGDDDTTLRSAQTLCIVVDGTGLTSERCSISVRRSSVDVHIDTNSAEARKMCREMVDLMSQQGFRFYAGWQIRIYSPYSGDHTIATCALNSL